VLNIRLAKRAEAKPKQIKVDVGSQKGIEGKKPESQPHTASKGGRLPNSSFALSGGFLEGDELGSSREARISPPFSLPKVLTRRGGSCLLIASSQLLVKSTVVAASTSY
jgi:hypothetical protein